MAPLQLGQGYLGPVLLALQHLRQGAGVEQAGELDLGEGPGDAVAKVGVVERVGIVFASGGDHLVEFVLEPDADARGPDPLMAEGAHGYLPALAFAAEAMGGGDARVVEEDLVE